MCLLLTTFARPNPPSEPTLEHLRGAGIAIRVDGRRIFLGSAGDGHASAEPEERAAEPLFLGYPHGPKTAEFVPAGRAARAFLVRLTGPLDGVVTASTDSFACNDRAEA
jgi:hypothetical protein